MHKDNASVCGSSVLIDKNQKQPNVYQLVNDSTKCGTFIQWGTALQ